MLTVYKSRLALKSAKFSMKVSTMESAQLTFDFYRNSGIKSMQKMDNSLNWEKWEGLVRGEPEEIQSALRTLKRPPKNADELDSTIRQQRKESFKNDMATAHHAISNVKGY